jgi:hypothetical protein
MASKGSCERSLMCRHSGTRLLDGNARGGGEEARGAH